MHLKLSEGEPVKSLLDDEHVGAMHIVNLYITVYIIIYKGKNVAPESKPINFLVAICGYTFLHREFERPPPSFCMLFFIFVGGWEVGCLNAIGKWFLNCQQQRPQMLELHRLRQV